MGIQGDCRTRKNHGLNISPPPQGGILGFAWRGGQPCLGKTKGEVGYPYLSSFSSQNLFCFKLDAKSVPEALATTIRILLMFSIVLAHRCRSGEWPHPVPSDTPRPHPIGTPSAPHRHPIRPSSTSRSVCLFFRRRTSQNHRGAFQSVRLFFSHRTCPYSAIATCPHRTPDRCRSPPRGAKR